MSDIALVSDKVPAHVQAGGGLGNENVTADHLQTPRVKQLQQLSNEVDENTVNTLRDANRVILSIP